MCKYCDNWRTKTFESGYNPYFNYDTNHLYAEDEKTGDIINQYNHPVFVGMSYDDFDSYTDINYCPFCGKKLV